MEGLQTALAGVDAAAKTLGRNLLVSLAPTLIRTADIFKDVFSGDWKGAEKLTAENRAVHAKEIQSEIGKIAKVFTGVPANQAAIRSQIMTGLVGAGYSPAGAAAMAGNAQAESSFNPSPAVNPANPHYGLWQWSETRRKQIRTATGIDVAHASVAQQIKAAKWELTHDYSDIGTRLRTSKNAVTSGMYVDKMFERSGDDFQQRARRGAYSNAALAAYKPRGLPPAVQAAARIHANAAGTRYVHDLPPSVTALVSHLRAIQPHHTMNDNRSHTETHIGSVTVHTKSTDPKGVAGAIKHLGTTANLASQANRGLM
jgi:hypothetical protein